MDPKRLREVASKAGKNSQATGKANRFTKASASKAGKKGGLHSGTVRAARARARRRQEEEGAAPPAMLEAEGAAVGGEARLPVPATVAQPGGDGDV